MEALLLVHAVATWMMAGLIWFVQLVHYPLMARVGADVYAAYQREHVRRTSWVVVPVMLTEAGAAAALALLTPTQPLAWVGLSLLAGVWASTWALQVPCHARLEAGQDQRVIARLVRTNWLRTAGWSARGAVATAMLAA